MELQNVSPLLNRRNRSKTIPPVSQTQQWVFPQHPWTCISHDDFDLFPAIALVAMDRTLGASRFFSAESATVQSQTGVIHQAFAFVAKVVAMLVAAVDMDHRFDRLKFAREARVGIDRGFDADLAWHLCSFIHLTSYNLEERQARCIDPNQNFEDLFP